jgi:uncharacterized protein (TIGR03000 family)
MYSVVLATLMTAGTATPAWGFGCHGCHGCHGCWGGCHGCWGGCHGCWGGCYGCYGCCGGCYGCYGCCGGCYGCCGGCYGYAALPAYGYAVAPAYGYATVPAYGYAALSSGNVVQNEGWNQDGTMTAHRYPADGGRTTQKASPHQATVVVHLPADANLYVDGQRANLTSKTRSFVTPELQQGEDYYYTVKAEVRRDGVSKEQSQRVFVRAGTVAHVNLDPLNPVDAVTATLGERASARR